MHPRLDRCLLSVLLTLLLFAFSFGQNSSSCGLNVFAGPDKLVCEDNPITVLEGRVGGSGLRGFEWMPPDGLSNPNIPTPTVTVTGPQCYVLTAKKKSNINLVTNGNFEQGATGFSTDYFPLTGCPGGYPLCEGAYAVTNNPQVVHGGFAPCGDHTSGGGNMLVLNGAASVSNVWCQSIPVKPDHDYCFSAWAASVVAASPGQLEVTINGDVITSLGLSSANCLWEEMRGDWNSGGSALATVCILNLNTAFSGNDFAIDDIVLNEICQQSDTVCVDLVQVEAVIQEPLRICCDNPQITLDGSGSSVGPEYTYCWQASNGGRIVTGDMTLNPIVDRPGTYTLMVKGPEGCTDEVEVEVEGNLIPPRVFARAPDSLDCNNTQVRIIGGASPDDNITYSWTGPNGFTSFRQSPMVEDSGTYTLTITDDCGCSSTTTVTVYGKSNLLFQDFEVDTLDCINPGGFLITNSNRGGVQLEWTGPNGFMCQSDTCWITDTGWYHLRSTTLDGCDKVDSVFVFGDFHLPDFELSSDTITCDNPVATANAKGKVGHQFFWIQNGDTLSRDSILQSTLGGTFLVRAIGTNGCVDSNFLTIAVDTIAPISKILGENIECLEDSAVLCHDQVALETSWEWRGPQINTNSDTCLQAKSEGWYTLSVSGENGCLSVDSFFVDKKETVPAPNFDIPLLNCTTPSATLFSNLSNAQIIWELPGGGTTTGDSLLVTAGGWYSYTITSDSTECPFTDSLFIDTDFSKPSVTVSSDTLTCLRDSSIVRVITADSISSILWSGPNGFNSNIKNPIVRQPGIYQGIFAAPNGCQDTVEFEVLQSQDYPVIQIDSDTLTCSKTLIDLTAIANQSGISYNWLAPSGLQGQDSIFQTNEAGKHTLTVLNSQGCEVMYEIDVIQDTLSPSIGLFGLDTINCLFRELLQKVELTDVQNPRIEWFFNGNLISTSDSLLLQSPGTIRVDVVNDNGCQSTISKNITIDTVKPSLQVIPDTITCKDPVATLNAQTESSANVMWIDLSNDTLQGRSFTSTQAGMVSVTSSGKNGCTSTLDVHIGLDTIAPDITIFDDTLTCQIEELWLQPQGNADSISWTLKTGTVISVDSLLVTEPGWYVLHAENANGCSTQDSALISIDTSSAVLILTEDSLTCSKPTATLNFQSSLPGTGLWVNAQGDTLGNQADLFATTPGAYKVIFTTERNGCISEKSTIISDLRDLPMAEYDLVQPSCNSELGRFSISQIIGGAEPYTVYANNETLDRPLDPQEWDPGIYAIRIEDNLGCISHDTLVIHELIQAQSNLPELIKITLGDSLLVMLDVSPDPGTIRSVRWTPNEGLSCDTCLTTWINPVASNNYRVTVIDTNGCEEVLSIFVQLDLPSVYVPNTFTPINQDRINDVFFPYSQVPKSVWIEEMSIYSRWGELIFRSGGFHPNQEDMGWNGQFGDQPALPGVYVYDIRGEFKNGVPFKISGDVTIIR